MAELCEKFKISLWIFPFEKRNYPPPCNRGAPRARSFPQFNVFKFYVFSWVIAYSLPDPKSDVLYTTIHMRLVIPIENLQFSLTTLRMADLCAEFRTLRRLTF